MVNVPTFVACGYFGIHDIKVSFNDEVLTCTYGNCTFVINTEEGINAVPLLTVNIAKDTFISQVMFDCSVATRIMATYVNYIAQGLRYEGFGELTEQFSVKTIPPYTMHFNEDADVETMIPALKNAFGTHQWSNGK